MGSSEVSDLVKKLKEEGWEFTYLGVSKEEDKDELIAGAANLGFYGDEIDMFDADKKGFKKLMRFGLLDLSKKIQKKKTKKINPFDMNNKLKVIKSKCKGDKKKCLKKAKKFCKYHKKKGKVI